ALGDALVIRTAGARVTDGAALEVRMLWTLMSMATGATPNLELVIISHTQCGMERFAVPEIAAKVTEIFGSSDVVDTYAIADVNEAVSTDIERLRADASMPRELKVSGHVYDIATGQLQEVAPTTTLG
ncbi:MAG: hypothetical protein KJO18_07520, partial [Acidimicrobiia bacterium]|nr:hypothetical protein [Acidimicrobiia bacterium]